MEDFSTMGKTKPPKRDWTAVVIFGTFAFLIGMTIIMVGASVVVPKVINKTVETYTDIAPVSMPAVEYTEEFQEEVEQRVDTFAKALLEERERRMESASMEEDAEDTFTPPLEELALSEDELNALLYTDDSLKDTVHLSFKDGNLFTQLSIPIESDVSLGPWNASIQGRYINGVAEMEVGLDESGLNVTLVGFEVKGKSVPGWMLRLLQAEIEKEGFLESEEVQEIMEQLEGVAIVGDRLVLTPKTQ